MNTPAFLVVVVLASVGVGTLLGVLAMLFWLSIRSSQFRAKHAIPNVLGKWQCQWFDDAGAADKPKVEDTLEFQRWTQNGEFVAKGHQPQFHLVYPIVGEVDPSRVVILAYRSARYPYEPNRGVACMELSRDGERMEGRWFGRRYSGNLGGGAVICTRLAESAAT